MYDSVTQWQLGCYVVRVNVMPLSIQTLQPHHFLAWDIFPDLLWIATTFFHWLLVLSCIKLAGIKNARNTIDADLVHLIATCCTPSNYFWPEPGRVSEFHVCRNLLHHSMDLIHRSFGWNTVPLTTWSACCDHMSWHVFCSAGGHLVSSVSAGHFISDRKSITWHL